MEDWEMIAGAAAIVLILSRKRDASDGGETQQTGGGGGVFGQVTEKLNTAYKMLRGGVEAINNNNIPNDVYVSPQQSYEITKEIQNQLSNFTIQTSGAGVQEITPNQIVVPAGNSPTPRIIATGEQTKDLWSTTSSGAPDKWQGGLVEGYTKSGYVPFVPEMKTDWITNTVNTDLGEVEF